MQNRHVFIVVGCCCLLLALPFFFLNCQAPPDKTRVWVEEGKIFVHFDEASQKMNHEIITVTLPSDNLTSLAEGESPRWARNDSIFFYVHTRREPSGFIDSSFEVIFPVITNQKEKQLINILAFNEATRKVELLFRKFTSHIPSHLLQPANAFVDSVLSHSPVDTIHFNLPPNFWSVDVKADDMPPGFVQAHADLIKYGG